MPERTVVGIGTAGWDAGTDVFLDLVRLVDTPGDVSWCWVGPRSRSAARRLDNDVSHLGLEGRISWADHLAEVGSPVLVVVTARTPGSAAASRRQLPDVDAVGFDLVGTGADGTVPYPEITTLAALVHHRLQRPDTEEQP